MAVSVPYLENSAIRDLADETRAKMWDGKIPANVDLIAEKLFDIQFVPINDLIRFVHSEAHLGGSLDEIDYDPAANEVRLCFSVAHELGHRVLHPTQIQKLRSGSFAEWKKPFSICLKVFGVEQNIKPGSSQVDCSFHATL